MSTTATPHSNVADSAPVYEAVALPQADTWERPSLHTSAQHGASRNIRRHWWRAVLRVSVLITADLLVFVTLQALMRGLRTGLLLPASFADGVRGVLPEGFLGGWQFAVALVLSLAIAGAYGSGDRRRDVGRLLAGCALAAGLSLYYLVWQQGVVGVSVQFLATTFAFWLALAAERFLLDRIVDRVMPLVAARRVVAVCDPTNDWLDPSLGRGEGEARRKGWRVVATIDVSERGRHGGAFHLEDLGPLVEAHGADTVMVCGPITDREFAFVVDAALVSGCSLLAASRTTRLGGVEPKAVWINGTPLVELTAPSLKAWQLAAKRMLDICGATLGLFALGPVLAAIALWVRWGSPGPALFGQVRLGARGARFRCYKFRSMRADAEEVLSSDPELHQLYVSNHFKLPEDRDPRLTKAGRFLRRTSLDELPQLINVLKGDMSLVGPRPIVPSEIEHYSSSAPLFLSSKPGMTGAWAVAGRSRVGYPDRVHMELTYVRNWSLLKDLQILAMTFPAVLRRRGAH